MTKARDLGDFISDGTIAETVTADGLTLGDNEKIQLGASQDLQIFHDGSHSIVKDSGTGNLKLLAENFSVQDPNQTEQMILATPNGSVNLYYDAVKKFETTATGATVTGTIAVSGDFNATSGTFTVQSNGTDILNVTSTLMSPQTDGAISIGSASNAFNDMYLDGSAYVGGNVGIGTSSPSAALQVVGTFSNQIKFGTSTSVYTDISMGSGFTVLNSIGGNSGAFDFRDDGTSRMFIDSSGNVGIGTSSPDTELHVAGAAGQPPKFSLSEGGARSVIYATRNSDTNGDLRFQTEISGTIADRMVISYDGSLLVGTTDSTPVGSGSNGTKAGNGVIESLKYKSASLKLDRYGDSNNSNDGSIIEFYSGSPGLVGSIGSNNGNIKISAFGEEYAALSGTTPTVDCRSGNNFALSTTGNTTFTFSNPPTSGTAFGFTLKVTAGGTHTLTWPSSVDWPGGTAPDAPASGETNVLVFITYDGGTTWYGFQAGAALA